MYWFLNFLFLRSYHFCLDQSQLEELQKMSRAVVELEATHKKLKSQYEEEIKNLKAQIQQQPEKELKSETS
jgi:hypothetical protein